MRFQGDETDEEVAAAAADGGIEVMAPGEGFCGVGGASPGQNWSHVSGVKVAMWVRFTKMFVECGGGFMAGPQSMRIVTERLDVVIDR